MATTRNAGDLINAARLWQIAVHLDQLSGALRTTIPLIEVADLLRPLIQ